MTDSRTRPSCLQNDQGHSAGARLVGSFFGVLFGLAFSFLMLFLAALAGGAGHGSFLPLALGSAPGGLALAIWPILGVILPWAGARIVRVSCIGLLAANYLGVIHFAWSRGLSLSDELAATSAYSAGAIVLYLAGQGLIWAVLAARSKRHAVTSRSLPAVGHAEQGEPKSS